MQTILFPEVIGRSLSWEEERQDKKEKEWPGKTIEEKLPERGGKSHKNRKLPSLFCVLFSQHSTFCVARFHMMVSRGFSWDSISANGLEWQITSLEVLGASRPSYGTSVSGTPLSIRYQDAGTKKSDLLYHCFSVGRSLARPTVKLSLSRSYQGEVLQYRSSVSTF